MTEHPTHCACGARLAVRAVFLQEVPEDPSKVGYRYYCVGHWGEPGHTEYVVPFKHWRDKLADGEHCAGCGRPQGHEAWCVHWEPKR